MNFEIVSAGWDEITIQVEEKQQIRLLVADGKHDKWLVLWPGMGATAEEFISLLRQGPQIGINIVTIDPPGHGYSSAWQDEFSKESIIKIWSSTLSSLNISEAFIGGHSYGAYAAIWCASYLGNMVKGLLLLDGGYLEPFLDTNLDEISQQNQSYLEGRQFDSWDDFLSEERKTARHWNSDIKQMLSSTMTELNERIVPRISLKTVNQVSSVIREFSISSIQNIKAPSLLLYASLPKELDDERKQGIRRLNEKIDDLSSIPVPDGSHDLLVDNPDFVYQEILDFIDKHK